MDTSTVRRERCKHDMVREWCARCRTKSAEEIAADAKKARTVHDSSETTVHGAATIAPTTLEEIGFVVISNPGGVKSKPPKSLKRIDERTQAVHISGAPNLWLFEMIIAKAPNLKRIRIPPRMAQYITKNHRDLCLRHGVTILFGFERPEMAWEIDRNISKHWEKQKSFLIHLQGEQLALWEELLAMEFDAALVVARYFCLMGEEFRSMAQLAKDLGYCNNSYLSLEINAVLRYLDTSFDASANAVARARALKNAVARIRKSAGSEAELQEYLQSLGLNQIPAEIPLGRIVLYAKIFQMFTAGKLSTLKVEHPRLYQVLVARFDLEEISHPVYRTLEQTAELVPRLDESEGKLVRQRIQQLERDAFNHLKIDPSDFEFIVKAPTKKSVFIANGKPTPTLTLPSKPRRRVGNRAMANAVAEVFGLNFEHVKTWDDIPRSICAYTLSEWCGLTHGTIALFMGLQSMEVPNLLSSVRGRFEDTAILERLHEIKKKVQ